MCAYFYKDSQISEFSYRTLQRAPESNDERYGKLQDETVEKRDYGVLLAGRIHEQFCFLKSHPKPMPPNMQQITVNI